jgi:hypothetical protein
MIQNLCYNFLKRFFFLFVLKNAKNVPFSLCAILLFVMLIMLYAGQNQTSIFRENRLYYFMTFRPQMEP